ncbi:Subtilase family protein [Colwellia chukchiensis]|uniref:Subtilase family protein n=1 Tax=Colwellia chukchiensis TaxID=641665 RepID=A0A1H7PC83_9GAMM|nr:S8 family serine peptidase [Colwellia chukchiensis]SEL33269.1 Subtilase family protein [Colwellia chukchiensis]
MKLLALTTVLLCSVSTLIPAQQLTTGKMLGQINAITESTSNIIPTHTRPIALPPFALSTLPDVNSVSTEPLTALPKSLAITNSAGQALWLDVEVEQGWRAVQGQWLLLADDDSKKRLISHGAQILSESHYTGLGLALLRFQVPTALDSKSALSKLLSTQAMQSLARNHIYQAQSQANAPQDSPHFNAPLSTTSQAHICQSPVTVGIVDSAVDTEHAALSHADITKKSFLPNTLTASLHHGTVIASLLVGNSQHLTPLLPAAKVYAAQVFYQQSDYAQGATLSAIISGLNWLLEQNIKVINMSLTGPENDILQRVLNAAIAKGAWVIAAAGNEGPAAPAMYPAAYQGVIAVSAIDQQQKPYRWSNRGDYIDYAALGVNVATAQSGGELGRESGTSIAAPVVTATIACLKATHGDNKKALKAALNQLAIDLGPQGKDPIYGIGAILRR